MTESSRKRTSRKVQCLHLREARQMTGLTQGELAKKSGLAPAAISHFESGRRAPSLQNLCILADALECTTDALLGRECRIRIYVSDLEPDDVRLLRTIADRMRRRT